MTQFVPAPWTLRLTDVDARDVLFDDSTIIDGVYLTFRTEDWTTVDFSAPTGWLQSHAVTSGRVWTLTGSFGDVAVATMRLEIAENALMIRSRIEFIRDAFVNRVGLCVLFPERPVETAFSVITGTRTQDLVWPSSIDPDPVASGVTALRQLIGTDREVTITFGGGSYEIEDHRNWSDAGWKAYSPPLNEPRPVRRLAGDVVEHELTIFVESVGAGHQVTTREEASTRPMDEETGFRMGARFTSPEIGFTVPVESPDLASVELLRRVGTRFLTACFDGSESPEVVWARAVVWANALNVSLVTEILDSGSTSAIYEEIRRLTPDRGVARVALFDSKTNVTIPSRTLEALGRDVGAQIMSGSRTNLAELNRNRPQRSAQNLCFGLCPQIHHHDDERIMATVRVFREQLEHARRLANQPRIHIAPAAFTPRQDQSTASLGGPHWPDRRWSAELGAAWALGIVANSEGAATIEFGAAFGPGGALGHHGEAPTTALLSLLRLGHSRQTRRLLHRDPRLVGVVIGPPGDDTVLLINTAAEAIETQLGEEIARTGRWVSTAGGQRNIEPGLRLEAWEAVASIPLARPEPSVG